MLDRAMLDTDLRSGELMAVAGTDADETAALLRYLPEAAGALAAVAVCGGALLVLGPFMVDALQNYAATLFDQMVALGGAH